MTGESTGGTGADFIVRRGDLETCDVALVPGPDRIALEDGQVLLRVDAFALTANNITYATFGEAMGYWRFYPAPPEMGRIPVWGFADVVASAHPGIAVGERFYGFLPMSTHVVLEPADVSAGGFTEASAHRRDLPAVYNQYLRTAGDPGHDPGREAEQMLLRPLLTTSFLIDDLLAAEEFFGADTVILSSASSKTAYGTALQLARREAIAVVGLTSPGNVAFTESLGCYDRVVAYDAVASLPVPGPVVYVDLSGSAEVRRAVHHHVGDALRYDCVVGATHHDDIGGDPDLPGPAPTLFFAPDRVRARLAEWGPATFQDRLAEAWQHALARLSDPERPALRVVRSAGADAVEQVYLEVLAGRARPEEGHVLTLHEPV
ncbi:MAG TPA: DUF2855 family protein [Solirubrobacteraceae bacterium]